MKGLPTILSSLALLGVIILFALHFRKPAASGPSGGSQTVQQSGNAAAARIAYVDIDTFEAHYESLKKKKEEFKAQQADMEGELQRSAAQMQADYENVMRKQQSGTLSEAEGKAAEKRLGQMQQSLEARKQSMSTQFQKGLDAFNDELHKSMDEYLTDYTKEHHYDYVLAYSRANPVILYGAKSLDITQQVIKDMNDRAARAAPARSK